MKSLYFYIGIAVLLAGAGFWLYRKQTEAKTPAAAQPDAAMQPVKSVLPDVQINPATQAPTTGTTQSQNGGLIKNIGPLPADSSALAVLNDTPGIVPSSTVTVDSSATLAALLNGRSGGISFTSNDAFA